MDAQTITHTLGGKFYNGRGNAPCPVCQPERRQDQNALSLCNSNGKLLMNCFKSECSYYDIIAAITQQHGSDRIEVSGHYKTEHELHNVAFPRERKARELWKRSGYIGGSLAERYLLDRGITVPLPDSLRCVREAFHGPTGKYFCAMLADVQPTGGIHRTFLTSEGEKLEQDAKMMLGPCTGGAVRLSRGTGPLVVTEGIETALSLLQMMLERSPTVWAALSTSGMKSLQLPARPHTLIIAPDGDDAGRAAAKELAIRAKLAGWNVLLKDIPDGKDWNDLLQERRAA